MNLVSMSRIMLAVVFSTSLIATRTFPRKRTKT